MKTLMRHGLAVCLALTTMCTSLLLMYGGIGGGGGHPEPRRRQQQQVAAVPSHPPGRGQHHPVLPIGAGLLEGYISVLEHKVSLRPRGFSTFSYFHIQTDIFLKDMLPNKLLGSV
uniref:Uncharacterized protein n=1 Tax=Strix occidentalis caurina TaxID=311401 RepID=A0A8D0F008_STROC